VKLQILQITKELWQKRQLLFFFNLWNKLP